MQVAKDAAGELVDIDMALLDGVYYCVKCGCELVQRRGVNIKAYFAHKTDSVCSKWHLNWQRVFPESCREVSLYSSGVAHRADVLIGGIVLEFQHSGISEADWQSRSLFYGPDCETRLFWVYDRTDFHAGSDLGFYQDGFDDCRALFGSGILIKREFVRSRQVFGSDWPLFLDYGKYVIMCYHFVESGDLTYAGACVLLTRSGFIELIHSLSVYPWMIMEDFDMDSYLSGHAAWFLDDLKLFSLENPSSDLLEYLDVFEQQIPKFCE